MNFFIMSQGKLVEVTGQPLMAHIGNEHRLLASFDLDGQKWLADVAKCFMRRGKGRCLHFCIHNP